MPGHVLVTGAAGFLGTHLCLRLQASGWTVRALTHRPHPPLGPHIEMLLGDVRNGEQLREYAHGCSLIVHLVAAPQHQAPQQLIDTHVTGTLNVLHAALANDCRVLHTSSCSVYGEALYTPMDEQHPLQGRTPYAAARIAADMLAESFYRSFQLPLLILRPFPLYGPGQHRGLIPWLLERLQAPEDLALDPETVDLLHVADAAEYFAQALGHIPFDGQTYNLGSGEHWSLSELATLLLKQLGQDRSLVMSSAPQTSLIPNLQALSRWISWQPQHQLQPALASLLQPMTEL